MWSEEIINKYIDKWDWHLLSHNKSLPWDYNLIKKFFDNWEWNNLSSNYSIPWSLEMIKKYEKKLNFEKLSNNNNISWTKDLINDHREEIDWCFLSQKNEFVLDLYIIHQNAEKLISTNNIWNLLKSFVDDEIIKEACWKIKEKGKIQIAGKLTIKGWEEVEDLLNPEQNYNWDKAYEYFESRIFTRYLKPINIMLNLKSNNGEGFAIVNLQCSLIEMIECFINGWISEFNGKRTIWKKTIKKPYKNKIPSNNVEIFQSFFDNREIFSNYKIEGEKFFWNVRCSLLHETQTKNNWIIKTDTENCGLPFQVFNKRGVIQKIIYRENFQRDLEILIQNYKNSIIYGIEFDGISAYELRENFVAKFNHICKVS